jgi:hypothetical protein
MTFPLEATVEDVRLNLGPGRRRPERDAGRFRLWRRARWRMRRDTTAPADQYNVFFQLDDGWFSRLERNDNAFGVQPDFVAVPEPGMLALLGAGFIGLLGVGCHNRRRAPPIQPRAF